jgi:aminoglycoside 3-N-acetyltransferase I
MTPVRLSSTDVRLARDTLAMMAVVFEEPREHPPTDAYVAGLLARPDLWIYSVVVDDEPVGGLTAFALPLMRTEATELFVYDIAVRVDRQRSGVGRALLRQLLDDGAAAGITEMWVPADNEDTHALDFYRSTGGAPQPVTVFTFPTSPSPPTPRGR